MDLSHFLWGPLSNEPLDSDARKSPLQQIPEGIKSIGSMFSTPKPVGADDDELSLIQDEIKASKLKPGHIDKIFELVTSGKALPGTKEFVTALGIEASQNGIIPTNALGPFGEIRDRFSPKAQEIIAQQNAANRIGEAVLGHAVKMKLERSQGPQTLGDVADAGLSGIVPPLRSQMRGPGPYADTYLTQPGADPDAQLKPWQQDQALAGLKGVSSGHLMSTGEGLVPTTFASTQGRLVDPETAAWQSKAALTPIDQDIPVPPKPVQASVMNKVIEERGQTNRNLNKGPNLNNRFESLVMGQTAAKYGRAMSPGELAAKDPEMFAQLRQKAEIDEQKDIYSFQQGELAKRQLQTAGPIASLQETARKEADRDQPVQEPQLWRHPETGKAASASMTTRQAQNQEFVKITSGQLETLNQLEVIDSGLREVKVLASKLLDSKRKTPMGEAWRSASQTAKLAFLRMTGDPDVVKMDSIIDRLTAPLVKSQGDTANIAVAEREMFKKALVNNQASIEAVLGNLDNVIKATRSAQKMMGFKDKQAFIDNAVANGMSKAKAEQMAKKKFGDTMKQDLSPEAARSRIQELKSQGLDKNAIKQQLLKEGFK